MEMTFGWQWVSRDEETQQKLKILEQQSKVFPNCAIEVEPTTVTRRFISD